MSIMSNEFRKYLSTRVLLSAAIPSERWRDRDVPMGVLHTPSPAGEGVSPDDGAGRALVPDEARDDRRGGDPDVGDRPTSRASPDYAPLWYWIAERERIRVARAADPAAPPPWTTDPILATYRFCNVRREDDVGTVWVREHVRGPYADHPMLWLMLCICRIINWPDTLAELIAAGAWPSEPSFDPRQVTDVLNARKRRGDKVYTGAYMIPAPHAKGADKQAYVAEDMIGRLWWRDKVDSSAWLTPMSVLRATMCAAHRWIMKSKGWGNFLAYQAVVDMRYTSVLGHAADREDWAAAGPGTVRGLNRLYGRLTGAALSQAQALDEMRAIYLVARDRTGVDLDFSDVPNVLCETDKYLRVQRGEGKPRARYVHGRGS